MMAIEKQWSEHRILKTMSMIMLLIFLLHITSAIAFAYVVEEGSLTQVNPGEYVVDGDTAVDGEFNVGAGETVSFQGVNNAQLLWKDNSGVASQINGILNLNDLIFALINQMGINVGAAGMISARDASVILSSLNISNQDFFAKNYVFSGAGNYGEIVNQGMIDADNLVALIGHAVENDGTVLARLGHVAIGAGNKVTMSVDAQGSIWVVVDENSQTGDITKSQVQNNGQIEAKDGNVVISTGMVSNVFQSSVNNSGIIKAKDIQKIDGKVFITAGGGEIVADASSVVDARRLEVKADEGIELYTDVRELKAENTTSGDIKISEDDSLFLYEVTNNAADGGVFLDTGYHLIVQGEIKSGTGGIEVRSDKDIIMNKGMQTSGNVYLEADADNNGSGQLACMLEDAIIKAYYLEAKSAQVALLRTDVERIKVENTTSGNIWVVEQNNLIVDIIVNKAEQGDIYIHAGEDVFIEEKVVAEFGTITIEAQKNAVITGIETQNDTDFAVTVVAHEGAITDAGDEFLDIVAENGGIVLIAKEGIGFNDHKGKHKGEDKGGNSGKHKGEYKKYDAIEVKVDRTTQVETEDGGIYIEYF